PTTGRSTSTRCSATIPRRGAPWPSASDLPKPPRQQPTLGLVRDGHPRLARHLRLSPSTLRKKLEKAIWQPRVKHVTAGITVRRVCRGSREPNERSPHRPRA